MDSTSRRTRRNIILAAVLLIPAAAVAFWAVPRLAHKAETPALPASSTTTQTDGRPDAVSALQRKIDAGTVKLDFDGTTTRGYLASVLKALAVSTESQSLILSKSSAQLSYISPDRPRALYFNDKTYVGWAQGSPNLEFATVDPVLGPQFYTLAQEESAVPKFKHETADCTVCHDALQSDNPIPRLLMLSVLPNTAGNAVKAYAMVTDDTSPFSERWGGWYVTGTHGSQYHLGNMTVRMAADALERDAVKPYMKKLNLAPGANVTDLSDRFDVKAYLSPSSDIVALMVLGHQTRIHNLITMASYEAREAMEKKSPDLQKTIEDDGNLLLGAMLFVKAAPLTEPVAGVTRFAETFSARGPRDSRGRSLHDLDLKTRLLRYPLSYLIYSESFDAMPAPVKEHMTRRLQAILTGKDQSPEFSHLSTSDRQAILEILKETKPSLGL